jgi:hypothetical protein
MSLQNEHETVWKGERERHDGEVKQTIGPLEMTSSVASRVNHTMFLMATETNQGSLLYLQCQLAV